MNGSFELEHHNLVRPPPWMTDTISRASVAVETESNFQAKHGFMIVKTRKTARMLPRLSKPVNPE